MKFGGDLAQAYMCAASNDRRAGASSNGNVLRSKAFGLLEKIRLHESTMEVPLFTSDPHILDLARSRNVCQWIPGQQGTLVEMEPDHPTYELRNGRPDYESHPPCSWLGIIADALDGTGNGTQQKLWLHIWGGGTDRGIWVGGKDQDRDDVVLSSTPRASKSIYFAQLDDEHGNPLSRVYSLPTFANEGEEKCSRNLLHLTFVRSRN